MKQLRRKFFLKHNRYKQTMLKVTVTRITMMMILTSLGAKRYFKFMKKSESNESIAGISCNE